MGPGGKASALGWVPWVPLRVPKHRSSVPQDAAAHAEDFAPGGIKFGKSPLPSLLGVSCLP